MKFSLTCVKRHSLLAQSQNIQVLDVPGLTISLNISHHVGQLPRTDIYSHVYDDNLHVYKEC